MGVRAELTITEQRELTALLRKLGRGVAQTAEAPAAGKAR